MLFSGAPIAGAAFADVGDVTLSTTVTVTAGLEATSSVGTPTLETNNIIAQDGFEATSGLGSVVVVAEANQALTGEEATATLGDESVIEGTGVIFSVTGVSGTLTLDDETVTAAAVVIETGLEATAALGNEEPIVGDAIVIEDGVEGTGVVNWSTANLITNNYLDVTGFSATAALGDNADDEATGGADVSVTGVSATGVISPSSSIILINKAVVVPTGVVGTTGEPKVTLWGGGSDDIPPEYTDAYREGFWTTIAA